VTTKEGGGNDFPRAPSRLGSGVSTERHRQNSVGHRQDHPPHIRPFNPADWPACWAIIQPIIEAGDTLAQPSDMTEAEARRWWVDDHRHVFVAESQGTILGTYYLTPNQPGRGSHVANGGYLTAPWAAGQGIGRAMGAHSLEAARALGYKAIQFNLDRLGFTRLATLPRAFDHARFGLIDAVVMHKWLGEE
jgi:GNAT superfamily N-acetyltransferase